ncbi:MAG: sugar phosphate isomerase/epimerase [Armatimonadetes bacterium]|nr:sugar phosphate isomerase/epimerase [Armatimonadota bacterium]
MRLSVMLFPFHNGLKTGSLSALDLTQELYGCGVRALEPMLDFAEDNPELWEELRAAAADLGMSYSCLDIGANLVGEGESDRAEALEMVVRGVEICAQLECPIALIPGSCPAPGMSNEEGRHIYSEMLAKAARATADSSVTISIEDYGVYPEFACHSAHVLEVVTGAGPDIKVTWDNGNFVLADELPVEAYQPLRNHIVHVHIKDWLPAAPESDEGLATPSGKRWVGAQIGRGQAQVAESLALVHADGYDGWISLEVSVAPALEAAIIGANYVSGVWNSL